MLHIDKNDEIDQLRQMAMHFNADFIEEYHSARMDFDNVNGKGYIGTYKLFPGLVSKVYNVRLSKELKFSKKEEGVAPIYFIYCVKGHYLHRFQGEDELEKINRSQNVIISGGLEKGHEIILPSEVDLQISIIFLNPEKLEIVKNQKARRIDFAIRKLVESFALKSKKKYFGEIDPKTSEFAQVLINNRRLDALGIIISEGSVLNTLSCQLLNHEKHNDKTGFSKLTKEELNKIIDLGDYINNNLHSRIKVSELAYESGLSPKKLQSGFNYLYGETVNYLIQRLRMERARKLLQSTGLSISEISYKIGITNRSYFSKCFKEYFDVMPSEFRMVVETPGLIFELSYRSKAVNGIKGLELHEILQTAKRHNLENNITGALVYYKGVFFQLIEGHKKDILELYKKIKQDKRHHTVKTIYTGLKPKRTFPDWSMACLGHNQQIKSANINGNLSFIKLEPIMEGMEEYEVFSDLLWRRVLNILTNSAQKKMIKKIKM